MAPTATAPVLIVRRHDLHADGKGALLIVELGGDVLAVAADRRGKTWTAALVGHEDRNLAKGTHPTDVLVTALASVTGVEQTVIWDSLESFAEADEHTL